MKKSRRGLFNFLMNKLSSIHKYLMIGCFVLIGYSILGWFVIAELNRELNEIELEVNGVRYEGHLRKFLENVYAHKFFSDRFLRGDTNLKNQILNIQRQASEDIRNFERIEFELGDAVKNTGSESLRIDKGTSLSQIDRQWKDLRGKVFNLNIEDNNELHQSIIANTQELIEFASNSSYLTMDSSFIVYQLTTASLNKIPEIQKNTDKVLVLGSEIIESQEMSEEKKYSMIVALSMARSDLESQSKSVSLILNLLTDQSEIRNPILESFANYFHVTEEFIDITYASVLDGTLPQNSLTRFQSLGTKVIATSMLFWEEVNKGIILILEQREQELIMKRAVTLGASLFIMLLGIFLGYSFVSESLKSLELLKKTALRISKGDLAARVPIIYQDEIGKVSLVFNHMASSLDRVMKQFRELLFATQRLGKGDFAARMRVDDTFEDEVKEVGESFNRMAESFEVIVNRLHRLVIDLTSSATQIAASSKQQEATITEQGVTTKQISVTATEISATSKDFSQTISEVSDVAEETSRLASQGRSNLGHMEKVMKQMEGAAFGIASRLSVLKEKASNITGVITTISEVSAQTNLLSLNAAIEAEKAGEAGRSFAVIAREIRHLADQTAMSTLDIEKIVTEIDDAVKSSVMGIDDFSREIREGVDQVQNVNSQLTRIMEQVQILVDRFDTVDQGMKNQSQAAEQINKALIDLSQMASETSVSMSQFLTTIEHLDKAALDLRETLENIR